ncbi:MAG: hypothetical protein VKI42_01180 [Synechococcaceae cyanobacterium]|nr:hypothetical protein [Synechococcaceae cyanobacterium]
MLITSLLITTSPVPGNRIFWGTVVPTGLLVIAALSHELWGCNAAGPARGIGRNWC